MTLRKFMPYVLIFLAFSFLSLVSFAVVNKRNDPTEGDQLCKRDGYVLLRLENVCVAGFRP